MKHLSTCLLGLGFLFIFLISCKNLEESDTEKKELPTDHSQQLTLDWDKIKSVKDLWQSYPERLQFLVSKLDLNQPELHLVQARLQNGDTVKAAKALLAYYKQSDSGFWLRNPSTGGSTASDIKIANDLIEDTVNFSREAVAIPKVAMGGWKWNYKGPLNDSEFAYSLNGHQYIISLLRAWEETGNAEYAKTFDQIMRDWTIHNPLPAKEDSMYLVLESADNETLGWRDITEVRWRDIEAGQRMGATWPQTFYGFQQSEEFVPATRLLILASIAEHAEYLKEYHKEGHNWTTMEMNGLALAGLAFPEFKEAEAWVDYALKVMQEEINYQVYPDGTQTELSTKTQWVALKRFESLAENFKNAKRSVPESYITRIKDMYNYLAYAMRPDGHQPLNNDSDREDLGPRVLKAADKYNRPDWRWIATNGEQGQKPQGVPSRTFPWAGNHIMRSGWDREAQWTFFDTGPFGTGHQHSDKLHLSVAAYGQDLLVDGGRFTHENYWSFDPTTWRGYFRSSFSHNVILIDGRGQTSEQNRADTPLQEGKDYISKPAFDYARGTYSGGYVKVEGKAEHTRAVLYLRGKYWVVVDRITTDRPRELQVLWHYAPDLLVRQADQAVVSTNAEGANLRITPVGGQNWSTQIVKGQTGPVIQGWYSAEYGKKVPNPTAVYEGSIDDGGATFGWVLTPAKGVVQPVKATLNEANTREVQVEIEGEAGKTTIVTIPLDETGVLSVK